MNSVFSVSQTDLAFVCSVAQIVAEFHYETKANQAAILQLAQEKLVIIRNEAEERRQYVLCGQSLVLQELIQSFQTKKPLQLPECVVKQDPQGITKLCYQEVPPTRSAEKRVTKEKKEKRSKKATKSKRRKYEDDDDYKEYTVSNKQNKDRDLLALWNS